MRNHGPIRIFTSEGVRQVENPLWRNKVDKRQAKAKAAKKARKKNRGK